MAIYRPLITIDAIRAENPTRIWYGVNTCWWTHRQQDLRQLPKSKLPCDPRGGMLMMTDEGGAIAFLDNAAANPEAYGRHGLRAFVAAHNDNCMVSIEDTRKTCFRKWERYNELLDDFDREFGFTRPPYRGDGFRFA